MTEITREVRDELRRRYGPHKMRRLVNKLIRDIAPGGDELMDLQKLANDELVDSCRHRSDADRILDAIERVRDAMGDDALEIIRHDLAIEAEQ